MTVDALTAEKETILARLRLRIQKGNDRLDAIDAQANAAKAPILAQMGDDNVRINKILAGTDESDEVPE